ncbi:hypothetical protein EYF80_036098 [Liparis tanakae]|uniref:Uncharacterized protein n=1 Tax=Liparis tanakae TaxID=230148 RepID=A0A4Z2GM12_9TELE|nr:hypothetical protein EYF80_036098 [Liparis tanakae]
MPMLFQPCMMGRKEMKAGITQQPPIIRTTRMGVILFWYTSGWQQIAHMSGNTWTTPGQQLAYGGSTWI